MPLGDESMRRLLLFFAMGSLLLANQSALSDKVSRPQIWFGPGDDLNVNGIVGHPDYVHLFDEPPTWPNGIPYVNVMQMRAPWFLRMPRQTIQTAIQFLKQHEVKLAVPVGVVSSDTCGQGVEGIGTARQQNVYPREMKRLGIDLAYAVMDEPLYYGHDYAGKNACQFSIAQVVDSVAENVKMIRSYYPNIEFVWVEPPQSLIGGAQEMARFLDLYRAALGSYPISVRFDIAWGQQDKWHREWHGDLFAFVAMLKTRNVGYGIIYDAGHINGRIPNTDAGWVDSAKVNVADWKATIHERPNQVVIQSWSPNPVRDLPETDPTTMTGYLKWFIEQGSE